MKQLIFLQERQGKGMKVLWLSFIFIVAIGMQGWGQTSGDYRSNVATMNWSTAASWQTYNGTTWVTATTIPTATSNVWIDKGCNVTVNISNAVCKSIQIAWEFASRKGNSTLTFSSGSKLTVAGNLTLGISKETGSLIMSNGGTIEIGGLLTAPTIGTWTPGTGTIIYNGADQTIYPTTYNNLTISGTGIKTISGTVTAAGVITVDGALTVAATTGSLDNTGGSMVINSTATKTGSFIAYGTFTGTANTTFNRDMDVTRWYILSSPVASNLSTFQSANGIGTADNEYNLAKYVEGSNAWDYYNSDEIAAAGNFIPGQGYLAGFPSGGTKVFGSGTLNNGVLNDGVITTSVTTSDYNGWNAVGNPYASALKIKGTGGFIEVNKKITDPANDILSDSYAAIYVWNETGNYTDDGLDYQYYKAIGNSGYLFPGMSEIVQDYIQPGQGFLVNVKTGTHVSFNNAMQSHQLYETLKSAEVSWPGLTLLAESHGQKRSTVVAYNEQMTTGLDVTYDAGLLPSDVFQVYTHLVEGTNPVDFAIQCLPDNQFRELSVPVGVDLPEGGELSFKASGVILPEGLYPVIEDKLLGSKTALKTETDSYTVVLDKNTSGTGRFYLSVAGIGVGTTEIAAERKFKASFINNRMVVWGAVEPGTKAILYDITGRKVGEYPLEHLNRNEIMVSGLSRRMYLLKIEGKNYSQVIKVVGE